jgi:hypothetical protein
MSQIVALWIAQGGSTATAAMAAAHAWAESSGRTGVTSSNPDGGTNVGLYQLDTNGVGAGHSVSELQDPILNTQLAIKGSNNGNDWSAWPDDWQAFISDADAAYNGLVSDAATAGKDIAHYAGDVLKGLGIAAGDVGGAVSSVVGNLLSLPSQVTDFFQALEKPVQALLWIIEPGHWARIIAGLFGFGLLITGLAVMSKAV